MINNNFGMIGNGLSKRVTALEVNKDFGRVNTLVTGTSTGYGGNEPPVSVPTTFIVKHAIANLAKEYELTDASRIFNFGDDIYSGQIKVLLPSSGTGFNVEYFQLDPNESWNLIFNWFARG